MKEKGYEIIKGRGISFADEKKVKVKGSEVNYSLQTIERILEKQRLLHSFPGREDGFEQTVKMKSEDSIKDEFDQENRNKESVLKTLDILLRPEQIHQQTDKHLFQNKPKKRKRQSHHL
jgi:predicted RNA binding protein with dsRBD fold (UPF0201 family)